MSLEDYTKERFAELSPQRQLRGALRMAQFGDFAKSVSIAEGELEIVDLTLSYLLKGFSSECSVVGTNLTEEASSSLDIRWIPSNKLPPDFLKEALMESYNANQILINDCGEDNKLYCAIPFVSYTGSEKHKMGAMAMMRDSGYELTYSEKEILHILPAIIGSNLGKYMLKEKTERDAGFPIAYSRSAFFNKQLPMLFSASETVDDFCLMYFDLDDFKQINDNYGHNIGDQVLRQVISAVDEKLDLPVYRIGGEEFAVIVPVSIIEGQEVAAKLRECIFDYQYQFTLPLGKERPNVSASIGLTQYKKTDTIESLITRADRALYDAKDAGKNQVAVLF